MSWIKASRSWMFCFNLSPAFPARLRFFSQIWSFVKLSSLQLRMPILAAPSRSKVCRAWKWCWVASNESKANSKADSRICLGACLIFAPNSCLEKRLKPKKSMNIKLVWSIFCCLYRSETSDLPRQHELSQNVSSTCHCSRSFPKFQHLLQNLTTPCQIEKQNCTTPASVNVLSIFYQSKNRALVKSCSSLGRPWTW